MEPGDVRDFRILKSRNPKKSITLREISGFPYIIVVGGGKKSGG